MPSNYDSSYLTYSMTERRIPEHQMGNTNTTAFGSNHVRTISIRIPTHYRAYIGGWKMLSYKSLFQNLMNLKPNHSFKPKYPPLLLFILAVFLTGCYGVSTKHYFATVDLDDPERSLTFYRVTIDASSFLTTSEYSAGFYDVDALHQLYGEVKKPESAAVKNGEAPKAGSSVTQPPPTPQAGTIQLKCDARGTCNEVGGANDRFTVIYGANADAVAQQIKLFAENENTGKQIAALLAASTSADAFERTVAAEQATEQAKKNALALAKELTSRSEEIAKASTQDEVRKILLRAAQQASQKAGSGATFDTSDLEKGFTQAQATYDTLSK